MIQLNCANSILLANDISEKGEKNLKLKKNNSLNNQHKCPNNKFYKTKWINHFISDSINNPFIQTLKENVTDLTIENSKQKIQIWNKQAISKEAEFVSHLNAFKNPGKSSIIKQDIKTNSKTPDQFKNSKCEITLIELDEIRKENPDNTETEISFKSRINQYIERFITYIPKLTFTELKNDTIEPLKSAIFPNISYEEFSETVEQNISDKGDNLDQSHFTDLCGKYCVVRLWIKFDPKGYRKAMQQLYFKGSTKLKDGTILKTSDSIIDVINSSNGFKKDPKQKWGTNTILPNRTDMLLMLTIADHFHFRLGSSHPYSNASNLENKGIWAGSTIGAQIKLLLALGFNVERYGDNLIRLNKMDFYALAEAVQKGSNVFLLVNSFQLNNVAEYKIERPTPNLFIRSIIGTHWITIEKTEEPNKFKFWEYGAYNTAGHEMWKSVCGGIVVTYNEQDNPSKEIRLSRKTFFKKQHQIKQKELTLL